jgi:hypothetical protein
MTRRIFAAALLACLAVVGAALPATAADGPSSGCQLTPQQCAATDGNLNTPAIVVDPDVPDLQRPDQASGVFNYACQAGHPAPKADPFAAHPATTLFEQYCYAGYLSVMYDRHVGLGSSPSEAIDYAADRLGLSSENSAVSVSTTITAMSDSLWSIAFDGSWLSVVSTAARTVQDALGPLVWRYMTLALVVGAIGVVLLARRGDLGGSTTSVGMILLILMAATFALQWPSKVAETAQVGLSGLSREVNTAVTHGAPNAVGAAGSASDSTLRAVHYQSWLVRSFGSADSATAKRFGPRLFRAGAMDLTDQKLCNDKPASVECQRVYDDHARDYKAVMADIKKADPVAYSVLQGKAGHGWRKAMLELAGAVAVGLLRAVFALVLVAVVLTLVLLAMAVPVMALGAVAVRKLRHSMLKALVDGVVFAVATGAVCCVAAPVSALVIGRILVSPLPTWFSLLLIFIGTVAVLRTLRPMKRIQQMTSFDPKDARHAVKHGKRGKRLAGTAAAYFVGKHAVEAGVEAAEHHHADEDAPAPAPFISAPLPPTPAPTPHRGALEATSLPQPQDVPRPTDGDVLRAEPTTRPDGSTVWVSDTSGVYVPPAPATV